VNVHTLKSLSDGGILDLDDVLSDVVDDREQVPFICILLVPLINAYSFCGA
jgi:hypothetical protein